MTLHELRWKKARMTQQQLADQIGVSRVTVARYESGALKPRPKIAAKISMVLQVDIADVLQMFYGAKEA